MSSESNAIVRQLSAETRTDNLNIPAELVNDFLHLRALEGEHSERVKRAWRMLRAEAWRGKARLYGFTITEPVSVPRKKSAWLALFNAAGTMPPSVAWNQWREGFEQRMADHLEAERRSGPTQNKVEAWKAYEQVLHEFTTHQKGKQS